MSKKSNYLRPHGWTPWGINGTSNFTLTSMSEELKKRTATAEQRANTMLCITDGHFSLQMLHIPICICRGIDLYWYHRFHVAPETRYGLILSPVCTECTRFFNPICSIINLLKGSNGAGEHVCVRATVLTS